MWTHLPLKSYHTLLLYCKNKEHKNAGAVYHASPLLLSSFYLLLYFPYFKISFSILLRRRAQDYNLTIVMRMGYVCAFSHFHYNLCGKSNVTEFLMSYILHELFFFFLRAPATFQWMMLLQSIATLIFLWLALWSHWPFQPLHKSGKYCGIQLAATKASHLQIPYISRKWFSSKSHPWLSTRH